MFRIIKQCEDSIPRGESGDPCCISTQKSRAGETEIITQGLQNFDLGAQTLLLFRKRLPD